MFDDTAEADGSVRHQRDLGGMFSVRLICRPAADRWSICVKNMQKKKDKIKFNYCDKRHQDSPGFFKKKNTRQTDGLNLCVATSIL